MKTYVDTTQMADPYTGIFSQENIIITTFRKKAKHSSKLLEIFVSAGQQIAVQEFDSSGVITKVSISPSIYIASPETLMFLKEFLGVRNTSLIKDSIDNGEYSFPDEIYPV